MRRFAGWYAEQPLKEQRSPGLRDSFDNDQYQLSDAIFLNLMPRHVRPRRIVEVGSGFSTCAMLDVADRFLETVPELTCIEPDPVRLRERLMNTYVELFQHDGIAAEMPLCLKNPGGGLWPRRVGGVAD